MKPIRMRWILLLIMLFIIDCSLFADDFTLKGKVVDEDGNAVELASVTCLEQGKMTMTNLKGEFSITLQSADSVNVRFSMIGYRPRIRTFVKPRGNLTVQITMHPQE